jgi:hypothetical protein
MDLNRMLMLFLNLPRFYLYVDCLRAKNKFPLANLENNLEHILVPIVSIIMQFAANL